MEILRAPVNLFDRIGLSTFPNDVLIIVGSALIIGEKTSKIVKIGTDLGISATTS